MHRSYYTKLIVVLGLVIIAAASLAANSIGLQISHANSNNAGAPDFTSKAPMATSGDRNVYATWWSNKTGNDEVMFKASTDGGKTFSDKMNLSNTPNSDSQDVEIAAEGNNVYVTWWERNQTMNEPVMRVSNDNGKTFGQEITLSAK